MRKIGVFFGSFNPPHMGHVLSASYAKSVDQCIERVVFVPIPARPEKSHIPQASFDKKIKMCQTILEDHPWASVSEVAKDIPNNRIGFALGVFRILHRLTNEYPDHDLCIISGTETGFKKRRLAAMASNLLPKPDVFPIRTDMEESQAPLVQRVLNVGRRLRNTSILEIPRHRFGSMDIPPVSSTEIREDLRAGSGHLAQKALPPSLLNYIKNNNLYQP